MLTWRLADRALYHSSIEPCSHGWRKYPCAVMIWHCPLLGTFPWYFSPPTVSNRYSCYYKHIFISIHSSEVSLYGQKGKLTRRELRWSNIILSLSFLHDIGLQLVKVKGIKEEACPAALLVASVVEKRSKKGEGGWRWIGEKVVMWYTSSPGCSPATFRSTLRAPIPFTPQHVEATKWPQSMTWCVGGT